MGTPQGTEAGQQGVVDVISSDQPVGATPAAAPAAPAVEDFADRELRLATEALAADNAKRATEAASGTPAAEPGIPGTPAATAAKGDQPADATGKPPPGFVPISAAKAERVARQKAEQDAAYYRGQAEALAALQTSAAPVDQAKAPGTPAATPEQRLEQIEAEQIALAEKYDAGDIKTVEWKKQDIALEAEARRIRDAARPAENHVTLQDLTLEERTAKLETDFPFLHAVSEQAVMAEANAVKAQAVAEGKPLAKGAAGTLELRTRVAQNLHRKFFPNMPLPNQQAPAPSQPGKPGSAAPVIPAHPASAKADLAASHPIDVGTLGSGGTAGEVSDSDLAAQLNAMTTEQQADWAAANPTLVQRVMGRAAR